MLLGGFVRSGEKVAKGTGPLDGRYRLMGGEVDEEEEEEEEDEAAAPIFVVEVVVEFVRCFLD